MKTSPSAESLTMFTPAPDERVTDRDSGTCPARRWPRSKYAPVGWPEGTATHAHTLSFICTITPANNAGARVETILDVDAWVRRRTDIEVRIREPSSASACVTIATGDKNVSTVWMWTAFLAGNLSLLPQTLTGIDENGRAGAVPTGEVDVASHRLVAERLPPS